MVIMIVAGVRMDDLPDIDLVLIQAGSFTTATRPYGADT
jgi:hypothetical protein